jgi:hypothetical protein
VPAGAPSRRLYLPRTTHRRIENFDQRWPVLERHGFEVFDPVGDEDPRKAFAEAEAVMGGTVPAWPTWRSADPGPGCWSSFRTATSDPST